MIFNFIYMLNFLIYRLSVGLMRAFPLSFEPILLLIVILCNLSLIHAVHFYLNGLFILLPLVQQC